MRRSPIGNGLLGIGLVCLMATNASATNASTIGAATARVSAPQKTDNAVHSLEDIRTTALDYATAQAQTIAGVEVAVTGGRLDRRLRLKSCDAPLEAFRPIGGRIVGSGTIGVRCLGSAGWTIYTPVWVSVQAPVLVVTRQVARGTILKATDIRVETRDLGRLTSGYITLAADAIGKRLARSLGPGSVLRPASLRKPMLVKRGNRVTLLLRSPGMELRATGKALADGAIGDTVAVRNPKSGKRVEGIVSAPGIITIRR